MSTAGAEGEDAGGDVDDVVAPSLSPALRTTSLVERSLGEPALRDDVLGGAVGQTGERILQAPR